MSDSKISHNNLGCCDKKEGGISNAYLLNASDAIIDKNTGVWRMKRKYGKFTRNPIKLK